MGTSFVEYKGFGFWSRDSYIESWLRTLLGEMQELTDTEPWQKALIDHWQTEILTDGGLMTVGLDRFLIDQAREQYMLTLAKRVLPLSDSLGRRTGELFIDLLEGRVQTNAASPVDYLW
jgi:hypothetical protein